MHDADGQVRLLIENKFWAGLTEAQPVKYLRALPDNVPSTLLFVVPSSRVPGVWRELMDRCGESGTGIKLKNECAGDGFLRARAGAHTLAVTSWHYVLETLERIARAGDHKPVEADVAQLRGLTDRMSNQDVFLPLREEEAGDVRVAQRMNNYVDLIERIVERLVHHHDGFSRKGLNPACGLKYSGHYIRAHDVIVARLEIRLDVWLRHGVPPLWWMFAPDNKFAGRIRDAQMLFDDAVVWNNDSELLIPIRLAVGVERDRVIQDAAAQIAKIARRLKEAFAEAPAPE